MRLAYSRALAFTLLFAACGDDDGVPGDGGSGDGGVEGFRAIFAPSADPMPWGAAPFPDDLYLDATGGIALSELPNEAGLDDPTYAASLRASLHELDGFGLTSPVYVPLSAPAAPDSLPADGQSTLDGASVFLVDADPASATAFQRVPVQVRWGPRPAVWHLPCIPLARLAAVPGDRGAGPP